MVYDYLDPAVLVLTRMAAKRQVGYRNLVYVIEALSNRPIMVPMLILPEPTLRGAARIHLVDPVNLD